MGKKKRKKISDEPVIYCPRCRRADTVAEIPPDSDVYICYPCGLEFAIEFDDSQACICHGEGCDICSDEKAGRSSNASHTTHAVKPTKPPSSSTPVLGEMVEV